MKNLTRLALLVFCLCLVACNYSYGERSQDDGDKFEFTVPIRVSVNGRESVLGELSHLTSYENPSGQSGRGVWKSSRLRFWFGGDSGLELVPDSVRIIHTDLEGRIFRVMRTEVELDQCRGRPGCNGTYTLRYEKALPKQIIEHVSFTLLARGQAHEFDFTYPLEQSYHGSLWDALIGI
jgi:hypothetical protein